MYRAFFKIISFLYVLPLLGSLFELSNVTFKASRCTMPHIKYLYIYCIYVCKLFVKILSKLTWILPKKKMNCNKTDWPSPYLGSKLVAMKIRRVQVQLYWVCLVVKHHLLHHPIIDEPADTVHEVLSSIHWGKLAHKSSVLPLRS